MVGVNDLRQFLEEPSDVEAGAIPAKARELRSIALVGKFVERSAQELPQDGPLAQELLARTILSRNSK